MQPTTRLRRGIVALAAMALAATGLGTLPAAAAVDGTGLVINEFYGRGGSANQPYTHKFVELYNPTAAAITLAGTSLQYRSATGSGNATGIAPLSGTVKARGYFLVSMNSNGTGGAALPTADQTTALSPSGTTGTIFLTTTTAATTPDSAAVIDKLGYGGSNSPEGTAAPYDGTNATPGSLNRTSFVDTDNNVADFSFSTAVTPQNSGATTPDPDPEPTEATIAEIQGPGSASPLVGTEVITQGVVTAVDAPRPRRATPRSSRPTGLQAELRHERAGSHRPLRRRRGHHQRHRLHRAERGRADHLRVIACGPTAADGDYSGSPCVSLSELCPDFAKPFSWAQRTAWLRRSTAILR